MSTNVRHGAVGLRDDISLPDDRLILTPALHEIKASDPSSEAQSTMQCENGTASKQGYLPIDVFMCALSVM